MCRVMKLLFALISLFYLSSLSASAASEWLYYKEYPWVWDYKTKDWLFLQGRDDGKIFAYRNSTQKWEEFKRPVTWDEQYEEWLKNPEPYGGTQVLQFIKKYRDENTTNFYLNDAKLSDLTPLAGLTNIEYLYLGNNNISDLTPLKGLTNLRTLSLGYNNISDLTPLAGLTNLEYLWLTRNNISNLSPLAGLTNLGRLSLLEGNNISDLSPLDDLKVNYLGLVD